ncbi:MAG: hypothetical protein WKG03_19550 [Telluria sp.]
MTPVLHRLALSLSIAAIAVTSSPSFAQDSAVAVASHSVDYKVKGPVPLSVTFRGERDKTFMNELGIVNRSNVLAANAAKLALGVAMIALTGTGHVQGSNKEYFYGDRISDVTDRRNLASPFLRELPAALDKKILEVIADSPELGAVPYNKVMTITPSGFTLQYEELLAGEGKEDQFVLRLAADFSKVLEGEEDRFLRKARGNVRGCVYVSKPQALSAWKANDYAAVAVEQKLATQACVDSIAQSLPTFLGYDARTRIRDAKLNCKNTHKTCVAATETIPEPLEAKKLCKVEYNECVATDVRPIIDSTPIGACKATYAACKTTSNDKARAINPEGKADKTEIAACVTGYKACIDTVR